MWELNFRGLGLALQLLLLLLLLAPLCQPSVGKTTATATTDGLPHPLLTADRDAKVLELVCRPPTSITIKSNKIYDLKLRFSRLARDFRFSRLARDVTLASVTTAMEIPRRVEVPDNARVNFNGDWNSPSLSVLMPFTSEDFGEYSCSGQYQVQGSTGGTEFAHFNTNITVNGSQPPPRNNFEVHVIDAHEVRVTWRSPKSSKFIQASVSSTFVDKDGKDTAAGRSLVTTNGSKTFVYTSKVLLEEFRKPNGDVGNFSMRLYVNSEMCGPYCRYSCDVPYTACFGQDVQFCVCSQEGVSHNQHSAPESTDLESTTKSQDQDPEPESTDFKSAFIAMLILLILSAIGNFVLFKTGKFQTCTCLGKSVAGPADNVQPAKQNSPDGDNREGLTSGRGTHPQEGPNDASKQNPLPARSKQNDEPQSSTPPSEGIGPSHAEEKAETRSDGQATVVLPPPTASSGDNNPTPNDDESGAERDVSDSLLNLACRSEDRHETKDNSPSDDHRPTEATDTHPNPVQSERDMQDDNEVTAPENRLPNATGFFPYDLHSSVTGDETQTPLLKPSTSQSQTPA